MDTITVALDAMGGDYGPSVVVPAAITALKNHPKLSLILVGDEQQIRAHLSKTSQTLTQRLKVKHTTEVVEMDEPPAKALRNKKDSSMRVTCDLLKSGEASACVSAGNTGALMATARFVLNTMSGISRPAICTMLPCMTGRGVFMLDLGANIDSSAEHLFQFAIMGSELCQCVRGDKAPRVALLNIGEEDIKGNEQVKQTHQLLSQTDKLNYVGYVEGDDIYYGTVDVVVCDGFVGNVVLKSSEGLANMVMGSLKSSFKRTWYTKALGLLVKPVLKSMREDFDTDRYNGASLIGLNGIVIKSHGGANKRAFYNAIKQAMIESEENILARISKRIDNNLTEEAS